jgi:hypothetical protein
MQLVVSLLSPLTEGERREEKISCATFFLFPTLAASSPDAATQT